MPTGRVVGVLQRNWRSYVATLQDDESASNVGSVSRRSKSARVPSHPMFCVPSPSQSQSQFVLAVPMDRRIPKIRIKTKQAAQLAHSRLLVALDTWEVGSGAALVG